MVSASATDPCCGPRRAARSARRGWDARTAVPLAVEAGAAARPAVICARCCRSSAILIRPGRRSQSRVDPLQQSPAVGESSPHRLRRRGRCGCSPSSRSAGRRAGIPPARTARCREELADLGAAVVGAGVAHRGIPAVVVIEVDRRPCRSRSSRRPARGRGRWAQMVVDDVEQDGDPASVTRPDEGLEDCGVP